MTTELLEEVINIKHQTNCSNCGAALVIDVKNKMLRCEYCHTSILATELFPDDSGTQFKNDLSKYLHKLSIWRIFFWLPPAIVLIAYTILSIEAALEQNGSQPVEFAALIIIFAAAIIGTILLVIQRPKAPAPVKKVGAFPTVIKQIGIYAAIFALVPFTMFIILFIKDASH